jgi:hypothetical protein
MKTPLVILALALLGTGAAAASEARLAQSSPSQRQTLYGHVRSIDLKGGRFELRLDPAWWLTGVAAERACGCGPVANDYYIVDESHRLLTFPVRRDARVTILVRGGSGPRPTATISVAELAQIVKGRNPRHRRLLEPKAGFWITVGVKYPNPVVSLDQQYQP